jgi:hypothetical protein
VKALIYIPRMFTRDEFKDLADTVPPDFERISEDFWAYIHERLKAVARRIRCVYTDFTPPTEALSPANSAAAIVGGLMETGVTVQAAVDPLHAAEAAAWREMMRTTPSPMVQNLYEECLSEVGQHVRDVIDQTLEDDGMGVLFLHPLLKVAFPEDLRLITMFPFDPQDYLNRHQVRRRQ